MFNSNFYYFFFFTLVIYDIKNVGLRTRQHLCVLLYLVTRWQIWATSPASWRFRNRWSIGEKRDRLKASVSTPLSLNQFIYHLNRTNYGIVSSLTRYCHLGAPLSLVMELLMATVSWFQVSSPHTKLNDLFTHSTVINTLTWIEFKKQNTNKQKNISNVTLDLRLILAIYI